MYIEFQKNSNVHNVPFRKQITQTITARQIFRITRTKPKPDTTPKTPSVNQVKCRPRASQHTPYPIVASLHLQDPGDLVFTFGPSIQRACGSLWTSFHLRSCARCRQGCRFPERAADAAKPVSWRVPPRMRARDWSARDAAGQWARLDRKITLFDSSHLAYIGRERERERMDELSHCHERLVIVGTRGPDNHFVVTGRSRTRKLVICLPSDAGNRRDGIVRFHALQRATLLFFLLCLLKCIVVELTRRSGVRLMDRGLRGVD